MRALILVAAMALAIALAASSTSPALSVHAQVAATANCAAIGTPKPALGYTYQHSESTGKTSQYTDHWESVTRTGSRVRVSGPAGTEYRVNEHRIVDDVAVLDRMSKVTSTGSVIESTSFQPGLIGDPAFRACAGRSWPIPSVTASYQSNQTRASMNTPAGTLKIVAIREKITVPAGEFDTVHYIRTSQSVDEYWKSIEHGVVVKHIATIPSVGGVTEVLMSIK